MWGFLEHTCRGDTRFGFCVDSEVNVTMWPPPNKRIYVLPHQIFPESKIIKVICRNCQLCHDSGSCFYHFQISPMLFSYCGGGGGAAGFVLCLLVRNQRYQFIQEMSQILRSVNISNNCTMIKEALPQSFVFHHHFNEHSHHNWPPLQEFYTVQTLKALRYFVVTVAMTVFQAALDRHALKAPFVSVEVGFYGFMTTQTCERCPENRRAKWNNNRVILHIQQTLKRLARIGPGTFTLLWSFKWWLYSLAFDPVILLLQYLFSTLVNLVDFKCALKCHITTLESKWSQTDLFLLATSIKTSSIIYNSGKILTEYLHMSPISLQCLVLGPFVVPTQWSSDRLPGFNATPTIFLYYHWLSVVEVLP